MLYMVKVTEPSKQLRGWGPTFEKPSRGSETYPDLCILSCKDNPLFFSCCNCHNKQHTIVELQQQQAYECRSSGVLLLKCRWVLLILLMMLSARVPVTVWPRRARVHLVQSTDRFFAVQLFPTRTLVRLSDARAVRSKAVQEQQQQTYECCSNRVLLECC